jgi:hypothetical protein
LVPAKVSVPLPTLTSEPPMPPAEPPSAMTPFTVVERLLEASYMGSFFNYTKALGIDQVARVTAGVTGVPPNGLGGPPDPGKRA